MKCQILIRTAVYRVRLLSSHWAQQLLQIKPASVRKSRDKYSAQDNRTAVDVAVFCPTQQSDSRHTQALTAGIYQSTVEQVLTPCRTTGWHRRAESASCIFKVMELCPGRCWGDSGHTNQPKNYTPTSLHLFSHFCTWKTSLGHDMETF